MVGFRFERLEDTAESCTRHLVKQQLAASQGGGDSSRVAKLGCLEALGDRAYQVKHLLAAKSMWVKEAVSHDQPVYTIAYRNGHGGVTLASSTKYGGYDWDLVMQNPGNREW
jgi:hypothetical protein